MTAAFCFFAWCVFGTPEPPEWSVLLALDTYSRDEVDERVIAGSYGPVLGGLVTGDRPTAFGAVSPLHLAMKRLHFLGGVGYASRPLPRHGTKANWIAQASLQIAKNLSVGWLHVSNAGIGDVQNPSLDAAALSWAF